ncbi:hypothetical protein ABPG77_011271 [Micractinium sp. CCAP 211/92]
MTMRSPLLLAALLLGSVLLAAAHPRLKDFANSADARAVAALLKALSPDDRRALFKSWKAENAKNYGDGTQEDNARFKAWSQNLADMVAWNSQSDVKFLKGLNQFSDQSFSDFAAERLMNNLDTATLAEAQAAAAPAPARRSSRKLQATLPASWDWRAQGKVPAPRDQGGCGSCWAFAATGAMEIKAKIDGVNLNPDNSEQQAVDCVNTAYNWGSAACSGGYSHEVLSYASQLYLTSEAAYPYTSGSTGVNGACRVNASSAPAPGSLKLSGSGYYTAAADATSIMTAVTTAPVVIYFYVDGSFYGYSSGVYQASACSATSGINHAMIVVGYNATAGIGSPDSYWIVRNSWGPGWGDNGYIKVQMMGDTVGACAMYTWARFVPNLTSDPVPKTCPTCATNQFCSSSGVCTTCPTNCATCTNSTTCTACAPGWKGAGCSQPDCGSKCASNQFCGVVNGAPTCQNCGANCATCTGSSGCTSCLAGWTGTPSCSTPNCGNNCSSAQYCGVVNGTPTCQKCPTNCATCSGPNTCTSCVYGYTGTNCGTTCSKKGALCLSNNNNNCCSGQCKSKLCT